MLKSIIHVLLEAMAIALGCVIAFALIHRRFSAHLSLIIALCLTLFWFVARALPLAVRNIADRWRNRSAMPWEKEPATTPAFTESLRTVLIVVAVEVVVLTVVANVF